MNATATATIILDLFYNTARLEMIEYPIIQWAVVSKLERAQRMGDALHRVADDVGEVIHRIYAPFIICHGMLRSFYDAIKHGVAHNEIGGAVVDFSTE